MQSLKNAVTIHVDFKFLITQLTVHLKELNELRLSVVCVVIISYELWRGCERFVRLVLVRLLFVLESSAS